MRLRQKAAFKTYSPKTLITASGEVGITRRYYRCRHCRTTQTPWDAWAGVGADHLTPHVRRLAVLAGASGLIEGACKTVVGKRLKHGGAGWHVPGVENVAALCCLLYSDEWEAFWQTHAA